VVDECSATDGCHPGTVDASQAVWDDLGLWGSSNYSNNVICWNILEPIYCYIKVTCTLLPFLLLLLNYVKISHSGATN
jgi:hypothetical protein